jgi:tetratricopeptide (TPR) repeat protein
LNGSNTRRPDDSFIREVQSVYDRGLCLDALRLAESFAPLRHWAGIKACVLASRIAINTGAPRLSALLTVRARRENPDDTNVLAQYSYEIHRQRGPFALWRLLRDWQERGEPAEQRAEILVLKSMAAADLRDFANAESLQARAEGVDPAGAWIRLQRAHLLERQDRVEEALDTARAACALHPHPFYRTGVQTCAHLLQLLDRDDEAIRLLQDAGAVLQSGPVAAQLFGLLSENGRWAGAAEALDRYEAMSPLLEKPVRRWLESQRARAFYHLGRRDAAAETAGKIDDDFHRRFAGKLREAPPAVERVQLDVTFVRQHFKTCAPATLAAIGRFWRMPSEHLKLAEAMCYDGTPHWQQREWAGKNGWCVREFTVTPGSAVDLIERGLPFAISVVEASSAHMMAVIGFDRTRGTLLLRDPGQPYVIETDAEEFLKHCRAFGPHGMVFVPVAEQSRLDGVVLPDGALRECRHRFAVLLSNHDRAGAVAAREEMEKLDAGAMLTWETRLDLASYDANLAEQSRCLDELLKLFPDNATRMLRKLECLRNHSREEQCRFLRAACAGGKAAPALMVALGRALIGDARQWAEAHRWLRRAMRFLPADSSAMHALADLLWEQRRLDEATECYRFAANLEGFREQLYQAWFLACRRTRRTGEAMAHLTDRFARFGARSEQPALTLAWAWREMEQPARAREVLDEAIRQRPDDGYLLLRAAGLLSALGETAGADQLHQTARGRVRENDWLRSRAEIAENRLDHATVLEVSRALLEREPLALDAHAAVARAVSRRDGTLAALEGLRQSCARFPHHYGLQQMRVEWSREAGPAEAAEAARELLRLEPSDAWALRELAMALLRENRGEEALPAAEEAARIEPGNTFSFSILGRIHRQLGHVPEAREQFRRAVTLGVDNDEAINLLLELARTDHERNENLAFIESELVRQVVTGDGLLAYREIARPIIDAESLLGLLRRSCDERQDLWHAWAALAAQCADMGRLDEALRIAREAAARFPHMPRVWLELAAMHQWRNEPDEEITAASRAFEINPAWSRAALALAAALERRHRLDDARQVHERAIGHSPHDPQLHAAHASLLWQQSKQDEAFAAVERALVLAPGFEWAWNLLAEWAEQRGTPERTAELARRLTRERPGEARVWMMTARFLDEPDQVEERLAAAERAVQLEPRSTEAWDLKAELLAGAERFEEAVRVCEQGITVCPAETFMLRGRRAWIKARRRHLPEAIALMRGVLAENQSYLWGWHQLASWHLEQNAVQEAAAALEQMQRLRPHDAWVNRHLGHLRLKQEDLAGARKAFAAAFEVVPADTGAAHNLLDLQLRDADLEGAAVTLEKMRLHQPGSATLAAEVFVKLARQPGVVPRQALEALCASPDPNPWAVDAATDELRRAGHGAATARIFRKAIRQGAANPQLGTAVVSLLFSLRRPLRACWFFLGLDPGERQRRAAAPLVRQLAEGRHGLLFSLLLWRRRDVLARDDAAWGQTGFALSAFNRMKQVARWLADWPARPDVQPWMLFNYCMGLRHLGRYDEANTVARHVVQTWEHREGAADMHLFLAVEAALAGDVPAAKLHLGKVVIREHVAYDQQLLALARALTNFQSSPPAPPDLPFEEIPRVTGTAERRRRFAELRRQMDPHFGAWRLVYSMRDVRTTFRRAGQAFQRLGAGPGAWWWFQWRLHWQWSLLLLSPVLFTLAVQPIVLAGALTGWFLTRRRAG